MSDVLRGPLQAWGLFISWKGPELERSTGEIRKPFPLGKEWVIHPCDLKGGAGAVGLNNLEQCKQKLCFRFLVTQARIIREKLY